ncbi:MAG: TadE/TadG family type IV pilus assembly protein [Actinomycetota bacterium]
MSPRRPPAPVLRRRVAGGGQRGASLVEGAIVAPAFFLFVLSIIELGLLAHHELATANASRQGARAAAVFDTGFAADHEIIQAVVAGAASVGPNPIEFVVVYRIAEVGQAMNPTCLVRSVDVGEDPDRPCNRYAGADLSAAVYEADGITPTGAFGCGASAIDRHWCPQDRITTLSGPLDLVGVHVQTDHRFLTGLFGTNRAIADATVVQIEPDDL